MKKENLIIETPKGFKRIEKQTDEGVVISFEPIKEETKSLDEMVKEVVRSKKYVWYQDGNGKLYDYPETLESKNILNHSTKENLEKDILFQKLRTLQQHPDIDGVEVDWSDGYFKYFFYYDCYDKKVFTDTLDAAKEYNVYFSSKEAIERARKVFGEHNLIKLYK